VAEHDGARLGAGALLDLPGEAVADAAEPDVPEVVELGGDQRHVAAVPRDGALGDHDDRRVLRLEALLDVLADRVDVERLLRDEHCAGPSGNAGVQGDPARVAAHHLDDEHPVVGLGGRVQAVDGLHRDVDRGVEPEGEVGAGEVVVDGLGHPHDVHAEVGQLGGHAEGVLAPDGDQGVDPLGSEVLLDPLDATVDLEGVGAARAEDGAAAREDPAALLDPEVHGHALERAPPAVAVADELEAVHVDALADDGTDDGVQAGTVPASGEHSDLHGEVNSPDSYWIVPGPVEPRAEPGAAATGRRQEDGSSGDRPKGLGV
jgi:hypothetical protein